MRIFTTAMSADRHLWDYRSAIVNKCFTLHIEQIFAIKDLWDSDNRRSNSIIKKVPRTGFNRQVAEFNIATYAMRFKSDAGATWFTRENPAREANPLCGSLFDDPAQIHLLRAAMLMNVLSSFMELITITLPGCD